MISVTSSVPVVLLVDKIKNLSAAEERKKKKKQVVC